MQNRTNHSLSFSKAVRQIWGGKPGYKARLRWLGFPADTCGSLSLSLSFSLSLSLSLSFSLSLSLSLSHTHTHTCTKHSHSWKRQLKSTQWISVSWLEVYMYKRWLEVYMYKSWLQVYIWVTCGQVVKPFGHKWSNALTTCGLTVG